MEANGTEMSYQSLWKFRELLNFWKANRHLTKKFEKKIMHAKYNGTEIHREKLDKIWAYQSLEIILNCFECILMI